MEAHTFTRVVVGRTEISVVPNRRAHAAESSFDVIVDGNVRATVELGLYCPPAIGVYEDDRIAVWAGNRMAFGSKRESQWKSIDLGEPFHAVYRLVAGWCAVTELTVFALDERGDVISRFEHREVIIASRWENELLVLEDFEANLITLEISDTLMITVVRNASSGGI